MSIASPEIDEIRKRMAQIRRDLHEDVRGVVQGAEAATDWRRFVRKYPWASIGAALAAGYLIVPRKQQPTTTFQITPAEMVSASPSNAQPEAERPKAKGWLGSVFGLVAPLALRAAQSYALPFAEQWMAQKVAEQMQRHPDLSAASGRQAEKAQGPRVTPPGSVRF